jgi:hypothetical protein
MKHHLSMSVAPFRPDVLVFFTLLSLFAMSLLTSTDDVSNSYIQIEQTNIEDKWGSRVNLQSDELPAVLATLLAWYLEGVRKQQETDAASMADDALGDLDEHPF